LDEEVEEEDSKKVTSNPEIQFKDFVNCDDLLTTARMTTEETCNAADKEDKAAESEEEVDEESPIPSFWGVVSRFEAV
jgi:hypothetical protein